MRVPCSDGSPAVPKRRAAPRSEVPDAVRTFLRGTGLAPRRAVCLLQQAARRARETGF